MATTTAAPPTQSTATIPTQQSPTPLMQWCKYDDEDFSSVIEELVEACDRMQQ